MMIQLHKMEFIFSGSGCVLYRSILNASLFNSFSHSNFRETGQLLNSFNKNFPIGGYKSRLFGT